MSFNSWVWRCVGARNWRRLVQWRFSGRVCRRFDWCAWCVWCRPEHCRQEHLHAPICYRRSSHGSEKTLGVGYSDAEEDSEKFLHVSNYHHKSLDRDEKKPGEEYHDAEEDPEELRHEENSTKGFAIGTGKGAAMNSKSSLRMLRSFCM